MRAASAIPLPRLMLVTDRRRTRGRALVDLVAQAADGGLRLVQVREPDLPDDALRDLVARLRGRFPPETVVVINGSLRMARIAGLGLHLPARAPALGDVDLGGAPYGRSVHDDEELAGALADRPDYLIAGTVFATESKPGRRPGGVALLERICRQAAPAPVFAIGGITVGRVPALVHAGAYGVAVCGAILEANDPQRVVEAMVLALAVAARSTG